MPENPAVEELDAPAVQATAFPSISLLSSDIFGTFPAHVYRILWNGVYTAGQGIDFSFSQISLGVVVFAYIMDTQMYRVWCDIQNKKLRVFLSSGGEPNGSIMLDTRGLFIGRTR